MKNFKKPVCVACKGLGELTYTEKDEVMYCKCLSCEDR